MTMYYRLKGEEDWNEVTKSEIIFMIEDYNIVDVLHGWLEWEYIDIADYLNEHLGMTPKALQGEIANEILNSLESVQKIYGEDYEILGDEI